MIPVCSHCDEKIQLGELIPIATENSGNYIFFHRQCLLRRIVGSLAHQQRICSCFGGTGEDDPQLSARENAKLAAEYFLMPKGRIAMSAFN